MLRRALLASLLALALPASATAQDFSPRIVGGTDAPAGKYPSVVKVDIAGAFSCSGTLITPEWVLTAGHCSSVTGAADVATPIAFLPQQIEVTAGTVRSDGTGGERLGVSQIVIPQDYVLNDGYDISLLRLASPARSTPTPVAGRGFGALWAPNVLTDVVGFGTTSSGGDAPPILQQVQIPILPDATCSDVYGGYETATQLCAGYAEGGRDSCQGDSGGPVFSRAGDDRIYVVGSTSYGSGCAEPNTPGVYARVSDAELREFIRSNAPAGVVDATPGVVATPATLYDPATRTTRPGPRASTSSAPGSAPVAGTPSTPAPAVGGPAFTGSAATDRTRRATLRSRGLRYRLRCSAACTATATLRVDAATRKRLKLASTTVGRSTARLGAAARTTRTIRLASASVARRVTADRRARLTLVVSVVPASGGGGVRVTRPVTLTGR